MKKKSLSLTLFNLILFVGILFAGFHLWQLKKEDLAQDRLNNFVKKETELITKKQHVVTQAGKIGKTYVSTSYPIGNNNKSILLLEKAMLNMVAKQYGNEPGEQKTDLVAFVSANETKTGLAKVTHYQIQTKEFTYSPMTTGQSKITKGAEVYIKDDGNVFKLTDLIPDSDSFKEILITEIESNLSEKGLFTNAAVTQIDKLRAQNPKDFIFKVNKEDLVITLPEPISDIKDITLRFNQLFDVIDANYLKDEPLKEYLSYIENKDREATIMHAGGAPVVLPGKVVALTFDDGPNPATTTRILDTLAKYDAKATFYVLGSLISGNEAILKRAQADGHEIANHTWDHPDLRNLSIEGVQEQISSSNQAIQSTLGIKPKTFRPPYGATNSSIAAASGLHQALWDIDTLDWKNRDPQAILEAVKSQLRPGATILMHDIHETTADALPLVMDYLVSEGYTFATFSELYGY